MAKSSETAEAFAQLALVRDRGDAAARHLFELCADNPEMMRKAAEAFTDLAEIFTRWKERARDSQRPGHRPALMHAVMRNDPEKIAALIKAGVLSRRDGRGGNGAALGGTTPAHPDRHHAFGRGCEPERG